VAVVVLVAPSLTYVLFGSLREGVSVTDKASQLPGYLSDTFLHLDFGYAPKFHKPRGQVLLDTMPVDIALLVGSLVCGVAIGLAAGLVGGARRRSAADRALAVGSAIGLSMPVYWFSSIVLVLFAPQSGYLLQIPFLSWYGGYVPFADSPLRWLQSLWVPWLVLAAPLAAMVYRMTRASLAEVVTEDFVRTARAKGVRIVVRRHALRAALSPVIGLVSVNVALLVTNVIVIERAFKLPGFFRVADVGQFGGLGDNGARRTEPPISLDDVQALIVEASLLIALTMFLADVLRAKLDPRTRM
jgi:peptide/nickel transport system permease protein